MNVSQHDDYMVIEMPAYLSPDAVYEIERMFSSTLEQEVKEIILSMDKVDNLLSAGLRVITQLHKEILAKDRKLYIMNVKPAVAGVLREANLHRKIPVFRNVGDMHRQKGRSPD